MFTLIWRLSIAVEIGLAELAIDDVRDFARRGEVGVPSTNETVLRRVQVNCRIPLHRSAVRYSSNGRMIDLFAIARSARRISSRA